MMDEQHERCAFHCAQAFDRYTHMPYDEDLIRGLSKFDRFVAEHALRLVGASRGSFERILAIFNLSHYHFDLMLKLLHSIGALDLFPRAMQLFFVCYRERHGLVLGEISSALPLSDGQKMVLEKLVARETGKKFVYTVAVDRRLIAGVRVQGESFVWEDSIAQWLRRYEGLQ